MEQKFDRKVFNISSAKTSSAKDIFDLLRTLPGVTVELNNNVKYNGAPATIYVDDLPAEYVFPKTEMIPVANVLKIELIDASLHNGSGKGGIINIKMKNYANEGLSGVAQANNNTIKFDGLKNSKEYLNVNYKYKKVLFFYNLSYNYNNSYQNSNTNGTLNFNSNSYNIINSSKINDTKNAFWNYGGIRIFINPKTRIRISVGTFNDKGIYPTEDYSLQIDNNNITSFDKYNKIMTSDYKYSGKWLNNSFYHSFDSIGKEISIWGGLQDRENKELSDIKYHYEYTLNSISDDTTYKYNKDLEKKHIAAFGGLHYNNPINIKTRWTFGWDGWFELKGNDNNIINQNNIIYYPNTSYTKSFVQFQTAYWRIGTTLKKWKFDGGISFDYNKNVVDYTHFNIKSKDTLFHINKDYFYWWPTTTIIFLIDSLQEIKFSYSKSIQSVWYDQLCDFVDKERPRNWSSGNSELKPTAYHNFYIGYLFNKQKWNINLDLFYNITNDDISYLTIPYNDLISFTKPANIAHSNKIGFDISSWISIKEKYDINLSSSINHTYISTADINENEIKKKDFGYNVKLSTDILFNQKISGTFYINYFSREITFEGYKFDYINSSLSITYKFFDNKLLITSGINNLFDDLIDHGSYYNYGGINQTTIENSNYYQPTYFITLQYKFRQGDRGTKDTGGIKMGK
jgi:hypothetical protein